MPSTYHDLTDLARLNNMNVADFGITDLLDDAPVLAALAADISSNGATHSYLKETTAPTVGFRSVNAGRDHSDSADTIIDVTLKILDASFTVDKALADNYRGGPEAYVAREARRHLRAAFAKAEKQVLGGTVLGDAAGFAGICDTISVKDHAMAVDATGSTATSQSSVYLVRTSGSGTDAMVILGNDGNIEIGATEVIRAADGDGKFYPAYFVPVTGWLGFQFGSAYSVCRIVNVDATKYLTDALLYAALKKFPSTRQPSFIAMNRRCLEQLRAARTATNATGAPAPRPTEVEGFPIIVTDHIAENEAVVAGS